MRPGLVPRAQCAGVRRIGGWAGWPARAPTCIRRRTSRSWTAFRAAPRRP